MEIAVVPTETATVAQAQDEVTAALRSRRGLHPGEDNNFALVTQDRMLDAFNQITAGFFIAMIALSSVGLMVGGVGVVAIMMISVTERTREIGVRKALGATRGEIMFQFLVEAATLTLIGCLVGLALGSAGGPGHPVVQPDPGDRPAALGRGRGGGLDPHRGALRALSGQQGVQTGSGGGVEVRVGSPRFWHALHRSPSTSLSIPLVSNKLRSFFTLLGIVVSVGFLVVVVAIIQGMNAYVSETLTRA